MRLLPYRPGEQLSLPTAPGWPHADTAAALSFAGFGAWTWLIVDDHERIAGECGVKGLPGPDGTVEIGYGLAGPSRGRGLGGRAVAALVAELAGQDGVRRLEARVAVDNLPSRRLLERLRFEAVDVDDGEVHYTRLV
jgi:ribosomal-protein-alanine N-acetyltransferase